MISLFLLIFEKVTLLTAVKLWAYQKKLPCSHLATRGNLGVSPAEQKCQKSSTFPTQIQKQHHAAIPLQAIKIHSDFICGQKMQEKPLQLDPRLCGPVAIPLVSDCDRHREAAAARESTALLGTEASKKPQTTSVYYVKLHACLSHCKENFVSQLQRLLLGFSHVLKQLFRQAQGLWGRDH